MKMPSRSLDRRRMTPKPNLPVVIRPNGPEVNSQGRKPLEQIAMQHEPQRGDSKARRRTRTAAPRRLQILLLFIALSTTLGCSTGNHEKWKFASLDVRKAAFWKHDDKPDPETPERLATSWTEATLNRPGQPPQRGFGGRLAFFKQGSEDPVRVEGQLVIYAFDESGADPYKTEPARRYIFPAEQLALYESDGALGPSYSVWLPWDKPGGSEQKLSLIVRFEPKKGAVVVGEQTRHYLAGPPSSPIPLAERSVLTSAPAPATSQVTAASFQAEAPSAGQSLATTTIALPRKLSTRSGSPLRSARAAAPAIQTPTFQEMSVATAVPSVAAQDAPAPSISTAPGYLAPPGLPQASLPSVGYQSPPPQAPVQPTGQ